MRPWDESLRDPVFWRHFFESLPPFVAADREEQILAALAERANMPVGYVRERMHEYLRGRRAELRSTTHPGNQTIN